ncbi:MAG: glycoside hydrolase family 5 protein [Planctomycetota bacterium]
MGTWRHLLTGPVLLGLVAQGCSRAEAPDPFPGPEGSRGLRVKGREILTPDGKPIRLRGFNVLWWANPDAEAASDVKEIGANCVRYMFGYKPAGRFHPALLPPIGKHVRHFTRRGLWVIPTVHRFEQKKGDGLGTPWNTPALQREFLDMWTHVIGELGDDPRVAAWEPLNEPHDVEAGPLMAWYREVVAHVRRLDPTRPVVVEGKGYSNPKEMQDYLKLDVPNVIYSFHMYSPHRFTHCKGDEPPEYPGKWGKDYLAGEIGAAVRFREKHDVPVYCGEWGAMTGAPGHERWLRDVASILEEHSLHWTHWAWVVKREPVNTTFDVNKHKKGIYAVLSGVLRETGPRK